MDVDKTLDIVIPARNEEFLSRTVEDILSNIEGNTRIIVVLDGAWANPPLPVHERLTVIYHPFSIGQRAATNEAVKLSQAKYVMKVDAHCAFDKGFDVKMMEDMQDDWTMVPMMKNLHAFDWVCPDGHRRYQSPSGPCIECGKETKKEILWIAKNSPKSLTYRFDKTLHFQYWKELEKRQKGDLLETLSLQGSCFMMTREKYWELNICDEKHGSWGQQGTEVACKTWLSGGKVISSRKTWYAHLFRTQGKDFGFPYPNPEKDIKKAREYSHSLFIDGKFKGKHDLNWLLNKFAPVPDWTPSRGLLYYTDNQLNLKIAHKVQNQLKKVPLPLFSVSLKPMNFGRNIHLPLKRGYETMFRQIIEGLKTMDVDVVYFCEHDVLYPLEHFSFIPPKEDTFYYNVNVWKVRAEDGFAVKVDDCKQVSGLVCYRKLALKWYEEKLKYIEKHGFKYGDGFEPGTHEGNAESFEDSVPMVDIRHNSNLTANRWSKDKFKNQKYTKGWIESNEIPVWGKLKF